MRIQIRDPQKVDMDPNPWGSVNKGKKLIFVMWRKLQYIVHIVNCILNNKNQTMNGNSSVLSVFVSTNSAWILTMDMFWTRLLVKEVHFCKRNILERIIFDWDCHVFESNFSLYIHLFIVILLNPSPSCITVSNFSALLLYYCNVCLYVLMFAYMY